MNERLFKAISDPARRQIFHLVFMTSAISITAIATKFDISRQAISRHIKILEEANLLEIKKSGRERICSANPKPFKALIDWSSFYMNFWNNKIDNLDNYLSDY